MKRFLFAVCSFALVCTVTFQLRADTVILDFSPAPGIQSSVSVTSGSLVSVKALHIASVGTPTLGGDVIGLDINWGLTADTATAVLMTPLGGAVAGPIAGVAPTLDFFGGGAVTPGSPLASGGLGVGAAGFSSNSGGSGLVESAPPTAFMGSIVNFTPAPMPIDMMAWDFVVTGSPGDVVTFTPSGVLGMTAPVAGGAHFFDAIPTGGGVLWSAGTTTGGFVSIVPEPSSGMIGLCVAALIGIVRRNRSDSN